MESRRKERQGILFVMLAAIMAVAAACTGESETGTETMTTTSSGAALTMDIRGATDVGGMRFEITAVDCETGEVTGYPEIIDKELEDILIPGGIEDLAGSPLDADSSHVFADAFLSLEAGCYDIMTIPLTAEGEVSEDCAPAVLEAVAVLEGETTEVFLINQCQGEDIGAVDIASALNHPPVIESLWFVESKFVERCAAQVVCATASDPDNDPIEWVWTIPEEPPHYGPEVVSTEVNEDGTITQCIEVIPWAAGKYEVNLTVYDLVVVDDVEVRVEDWLAEEGYPNDSHASLDFPFYASGDTTVSEEICDGIDNDCDGETDEDLVIDEDGDGFGAEGSCSFPGDLPDCDDSDPEVYPGAEEICDGKDNDCDPTTVEEECCIPAPVDIVLLEDLSGSFSDDLPIIKAVAPDIWSSLTSVSDSVQIGVASFVDKPFAPYGASTDYVFTVNQALTADETTFVDAVDALGIYNGADYSEAQLEALLHIAVQVENVGWRNDEDAVRYVIMSTDATYHEGPECVTTGLCDAPNNGDDVVDATEDFPTAAMVATALNEADVHPIFAVTYGVLGTYADLLAELGVEGTTVELDYDSGNILEAILAGIGCPDEEAE